MLEVTRGTQFVPGSNLRGAVAGASWIFALPRLEFDRIVCLGTPRPASLAMLARLGRQQVICVGGGRAAAALERWRESWELHHVEIRDTIGGLEDVAPVDLLIGLRGGIPFTSGLEKLQRALRPDALVYCEALGVFKSPPVSRALRDLEARDWRVLPLEVTPASGELCSLEVDTPEDVLRPGPPRPA